MKHGKLFNSLTCRRVDKTPQTLRRLILSTRILNNNFLFAQGQVDVAGVSYFLGFPDRTLDPCLHVYRSTLWRK